MAKPYIVIENFYDEADALRAGFEKHFSEPQRHTNNHQVWNYWHVPDLYTYLRTLPEKIMPAEIVQRFTQHLNHFAMANLGLTFSHTPWLSLYVNGCGQGLHNDSRNGQLGFVYSITKWDERNFLGGETILFKDENYWGTERIKQSGSGPAFYDTVPAKFNQLLIFDDRVIHGVASVQGTMVPQQGRVVMHGHLEAGNMMLSGPLQIEAALPAFRPALDRVVAMAKEIEPQFHGFATLRLMIEPGGAVSALKTLVDRILPLSPDLRALAPFKEAVRKELMALRFPEQSEASELTLPLLVGT